VGEERARALDADHPSGGDQGGLNDPCHPEAEGRGISTGTARQRRHFAFVQMVMSRQYYVYIMTNRSGTLYIGVTNDLVRRVHEHKAKCIDGFTKKYNLTQLVYYAEGTDLREAIAREKQLKGWRRSKKVALINSSNPKWTDLSDAWFDTAGTCRPELHLARSEGSPPA
jgi:putative endonuclease